MKYKFFDITNDRVVEIQIKSKLEKQKGGKKDEINKKIN